MPRRTRTILMALLPGVLNSSGCMIPEPGSQVSAGTFLIADAYPLTMRGTSVLEVGRSEIFVLSHPIQPRRVVWDSNDPRVVEVAVAPDATQPRPPGTRFACPSCCERQRCGIATPLHAGSATITARMTFVDGSTATAHHDVRVTP